MIDNRLVRSAAVMALLLAMTPAPATAVTPAECNGLPATHEGTSGDDEIVGTPGVDVIVAGEGNDVILGRGGDDVICAGGGDDDVRAGKGNDVVFGEGGADLLRGQRDDDHLDGGSGRDSISGGRGEDTLVGGGDKDALRGGSGDDDLSGGSGSRDKANGGSDHDVCDAERRKNCEEGPSALDVEILPRSAWGASEPITEVMNRHTITRITIHHAGDQTDVTGPQRFRAWQIYHMSRGWGDLAYHYIIGVDGKMYQGRDTRYGGDTGTNYDPDGHLLIVVEGNFQTDVPSAAQLDSLRRLTAWAVVEFDVRPWRIAGHKDFASTACPGANLYPYIESGDLRRDVEELIGG